MRRTIRLKPTLLATLALCALPLPQAAADGYEVGRYQIASGDDDAGIWRLDTATGDLVYCRFDERKETIRCITADQAPGTGYR